MVLRHFDRLATPRPASERALLKRLASERLAPELPPSGGGPSPTSNLQVARATPTAGTQPAPGIVRANRQASATQSEEPPHPTLCFAE